GHEKWLSSLRFSPDGSKIVTASQDNTARLWTSDGKPLVTFSGHADWVSDAIFHPDGQHVQTWSKDGTTRVWTLDGREVATRPAPGGDTDRAHLTRDGRRIVLRSRDSAPTVWSIEGELLATLGTHHSYTVAVSHDGTKVFASGNGGDASVYSIFPDTASLVSGVQPRIGRCFGIDKRRELLIAAAPPSWCPAGPDRKTREREAQQLSSAASQLAVQNLIRQAKAKLDNKQAWEKLEDVVINGADQGRLEEALKEVQEALVVAPSSPIYLDTRAHILLALGRSDEAEADFNRVLAAGLDAAATFWGVGRIADVRGDAARAIKYYEKATTEASGSFNDPFQDYARRMSRDGLVRLRAAASKSP
ncbi:MAG: tetratricopeptide repeat protein, partial [Hyphomicrobiales bacterium]